MFTGIKIGNMKCPRRIRTIYIAGGDGSHKQTEQEFMDCIGFDCPYYRTYGLPDSDGNFDKEECCDK